ncbi:MAG: CvpA family protein [Oscillospiraceae bacterium]|nr:CvpA family protein [Oscillospiraceae bacterium]
MSNTFYPYIYDLVLVVLAIIFICLGRKCGALKMLFLLIGSAVAVVAATFLSSYTADFLFVGFLRDELLGSVTNALPDSHDLQELLTAVSSDSPAVSASLKLLLNFSTHTAKLDSLIASAAENTAVTIVDTFISPIVIALLQSVTFILYLVVISFLIKLIAKSLGLVNKVPVIGGINRFLGGVFGLAFAALVVLVLTVAIRIILAGGISTDILSEQTIQNSLVYHYVYNFTAINLF